MERDACHSTRIRDDLRCGLPHPSNDCFSHRWVLDRSSHRDPTREQRQQRLTLIGGIRITLESLLIRLDNLEQFGLKRVLSG